MVKLKNVTKVFKGFSALKNVSFEVKKGEFLSFVGPSGAGKSTLLKILAQLETPDEGTLEYAQAHTRENPVILVFQDFRLFPHLTVFDNVAFGLRARRLKGQEIKKRVNPLLGRLGIEALGKAYPARLSGGEKQRVALARALVLNPLLLLLDEPFANLDPNLKAGTAEFIRNLTRELGTTVVCVTHDFDEAFLMSQRIGILLEGSLVQLDTPRGIFTNPSSLEAAEFLGPVNLVQADESIALGGAQQISSSPWVRAEGLRFVCDPKGEAIVRELRFYGTRIILLVEKEHKIWTVSSLNQDHREGDRGHLYLRRSIYENK